MPSPSAGVDGDDAQGLVAALPPGVLVTGGLAGDGDAFVRTWVLAEKRTTAGSGSDNHMLNVGMRRRW